MYNAIRRGWPVGGFGGLRTLPSEVIGTLVVKCGGAQTIAFYILVVPAFQVKLRDEHEVGILA